MLRRFILTMQGAVAVLAVIALAACQSKTEFRLSGTIEGLREADFYVYSPDGLLPRIDTLHLTEGRFDWRMPLTADAVLYVVYPNHSEQLVFAQAGKHVKMSGDASHLRAIEVHGTRDNDELTRFRLTTLDANPDSLVRAVEAYVAQHPDSRVAFHLQRQLTAQRATVTRLRLGQTLPTVVLPPDTFAPEADTLRIDTAGRPHLLVFWAAWKRDSRDHIIDLRRQLRAMSSQPDSLLPVPLSISLDHDPKLYTYAIKSDSVDFDARCYLLSWQTPLVKQIELVDIPYYILTDHRLVITALGTDWKRDILPALQAMAKPAAIR